MAEDSKFSNLELTGIKFPECTRGTLEPRRGRFGPIYKCTHKGGGCYVETRPSGKKCAYIRNEKKCGALMVEGTKTIPDRCSNKSCPNRNPHKLNK